MSNGMDSLGQIWGLLDSTVAAGMELAREIFPGAGARVALQQVLDRRVGVWKEKNSNKETRVTIEEEKKKRYGKLFILKLPNGISLRHIVATKPEIDQALNADCEIYKRGKRIHVKALMGWVPKTLHFTPEVAKMMRKYEYLTIPLGVSKAGWEFLEMKDTNAHLLGGGATGSGKSTFLRQMIVSLAMAYKTSELELWLGDLKGCAEFKAFRLIRHVKHLSGDVKGMAKMIKAALKEVERREKILYDTPHKDIVNYNKHNAKKIPFMMLIIDELAEVGMDGFKLMEPILRKGRSLGIHVIGFLQRASTDQFSSTLKSQFGATVCMRVRNEINGRIFLDEYGFMPVGLEKGHCIINTTKIREVVFPFLDDESKMFKSLLKKYSRKPSATPPTIPSTPQMVTG